VIAAAGRRARGRTRMSANLILWGDDRAQTWRPAAPDLRDYRASKGTRCHLWGHVSRTMIDRIAMTETTKRARILRISVASSDVAQVEQSVCSE
jgi:hypothetical protein